MKRKLVSAMLSAMLVLSMGTTAFAATVGGVDAGGTVNATTELKSPIYKVSVPTAMKFYIDPFEQLAADQITSDDFAIINKSNVALAIDATLTVEGGTGVQFVAEDKVTETDTTKLAYIAAEIASSVTETAAAAAAYVDVTDWTTAKTLYTADDSTGYYVTSSSGSATNEINAPAEMIDTTAVSGTYTAAKKVAVDPTSGTKLSFVLNKAVYTPYYTNYTDTEAAGSLFKNVATGQAGSAAFRFAGTVNTLAAWAPGDLTATVAYTFNGLTDENYTAKADKVVAGTHAYIVNEAAPSIATKTYPLTRGQNTEITVDLGLGTLAATGISSITYLNSTGAEKTLDSANYTF